MSTSTQKSSLKPFSRRQEHVAKLFIRLMAALNTFVYRVSGGRVAGKWTHGEPMLLLTTIGRKTGQPRTVPLVYMRDGERLVVVGSQAGMSTDPQWIANASANPNVEVEIGPEKLKMRAHRGTADEKARYWPALCAMNADYAAYQGRTTRDIPILILDPEDR
ncbi:MAG TPA: nitroreductase family deazaflavin-dependent oxidoreductase [Candidatus Limnocylindrales bacterium]|nr:nitroreductase family deazaflavin-dependent oxidoreductase [Candidatus Limnocylindrales bacterium]